MQAKKEEKAFMHMPPMQELDTVEKRDNPHPVMQQLREITPVRFDEQRQVWDVFAYGDCVRVLKDPHTFTSNLSYIGSSVESLSTAPPERHRQFRGLIDRAFTPKAVQNLAPRIRSIADELLGLVAQQDAIDLVRDFSAPLPVIVIAELLGVPPKDRLQFKKWSDMMLHGVKDASEESYQHVLQQSGEARQSLAAYMKNILDQRKVEPQDDLISALWQENLKEQIITEEQIIYFCVGLLIAGNETTTSLIGNAVEILATIPDVQERLQKDPSLLPSFVEEALRFSTPGLMIPRRAAVDVELGGQTIHAGDMLHVWLASANRDESVFPNANEFLIDRTPNKHIAFGLGIHFCLGAPLARLEAQIAIEALTQRFTNIRATGEPVHRIPLPMLAAKEYPITFDKK